MDEIALLRTLRDDVPEPTAPQLAAARARVLARATGSPRDRADDVRAVGRRRTRRSPSRRVLTVVGAGVLAIAAVVAVPLTSHHAPADAAELLIAASRAVGPGAPVAPGQYLEVTTESRSLGYVMDDEGDPGDVAGGYVVRTVERTYVPADREDTWVDVRYSLPPTTTWGPASVERAARRDFAVSATAEDPAVERAARGRFGNGELGGDRGQGPLTTADLPRLSRDPQALLDQLAAHPDGAAPVTRSAKVFDQVATLLSSGLVDPELTATTYRTLALLPDVAITDRRTTLDGRRGTAIGIADAEGRVQDELVIDLGSGRYLGRRETQLTALGPVPAGTTMLSTAVTTRVVDRLPTVGGRTGAP